jgi:hypothetical protein
MADWLVFFWADDGGLLRESKNSSNGSNVACYLTNWSTVFKIIVYGSHCKQGTELAYGFLLPVRVWPFFLVLYSVSRNSRYLRIEIPDQRLSQVNDSAVNRTSR